MIDRRSPEAFNWSCSVDLAQVGASRQFTRRARVAGWFDVRSFATIDGRAFESNTVAYGTRFPTGPEIAADSAVEAQRAADWTTASGPNGDHMERWGWVYLDTRTEQYRVEQWPVGTFFGVGPGAGQTPADSENASTVIPVGSAEYFVGNYHLHATLRDANDVANAAQFPTGPSSQDQAFANSYGTPGLLRDRHLDEIVETGHTDYFYGPTRRATP